VKRVLGDVEEAVLELLKPLGFELDDYGSGDYGRGRGIVIKGSGGRNKDKAVFVRGDRVTLYRWQFGKWCDDLVVCLSDPGSLEAIERWAGG